MPLSKEEREKNRKLYLQLPEALRKAIFSVENADSICEICEKHGIEDKTVNVTNAVADVLFGLLPPDNFQETLENKFKIKKEAAKKVAQEIYRFVFYPVKEELEELYKIEIAPLAKMSFTPLQKKPATKPLKDDTYREPMEEEKKDDYRELVK